MKDTLIISYDFFSKVLSLADFLEHSSQNLIFLISQLEDIDTEKNQNMKILSAELFILNQRATKVKTRLVNSAIEQEKILNDDEQFKNSLIKMCGDFRMIQKICEEISAPNYYININGELTK